jgi:pimeloyl-ACP methyl ester carboxylesterase
MMKTVPACICMLLAVPLWSAGVDGQNQRPGQGVRPGVTLVPFEFVAREGERTAAERRVISVPERRGNAKSRQIELHFVRFASTGYTPGHPIVFLAGGPGGSGIASARALFPLFMALREFGDVIALDQRGSGQSNAVPECITDRRLPVAEPLVFGRAVLLMRQAAADCARFWRERGIDLAGYTAVESARDLEDLRRALGAQKISLWGISYGARLAITAMRQMRGSIDRAILVSIEPPHATIKYPYSLDTHIARLQAVIANDPVAAAAYPDVAGLLRRVHQKLDTKPLQLTAADGTGGQALFLFGRDEMRMLAAGGLVDPATAVQLVSAYAALDAGQPPPASLTTMMLRLRRRLDPVTFDAMAALDYTAGISETRLARVRTQATTSLLGDYQSHEQEIRAAFGVGELGEDYRAPIRTDVPTLVLTGTLDGRYDAEDEGDALRGFSRLRRVSVVNGGHNLLTRDPAVSELIVAFLRSEEVPETITVPAPTFGR